MRSAKGFTLIEISLILVIFGLLFGGVLKSHTVVDNANTKNLARDFQTLPVLLQTYHDLYRATPGDDRAAAAHLGGGLSGGNGNGLIEGRWNSAQHSDESSLVWQHLRQAGLLAPLAAGGPGAGQPRNALNQIVGLQSLQRGAAPPIRGLSGNYAICSQGIPGALAQALERQLDDGSPDHGAMLAAPMDAVAAGDTPAIADHTQGGLLTVCMGF